MNDDARPKSGVSLTRSQNVRSLNIEKSAIFENQEHRTKSTKSKQNGQEAD